MGVRGCNITAERRGLPKVIAIVCQPCLEALNRCQATFGTLLEAVPFRQKRIVLSRHTQCRGMLGPVVGDGDLGRKRASERRHKQEGKKRGDYPSPRRPEIRKSMHKSILTCLQAASIGHTAQFERT